MTDAELDVAVADAYDCVKVFLTHCPAGSMDEATRSAMDYVKTKFTMNNVEYRKLCDASRAAYCDVTKTPLKPHRPQRYQGKRK